MAYEACTELMKGNFQGSFSDAISQCPFFGGFIGGTIAAVSIFLILIILLGIYIYWALAWYTTAKKLKYDKPWLAWIPIANIVLILEIGGFHWAWVFLVLIPILGWIALFVMGIICKWRIFEKRKYPGWLSLAIIIPQVGGLLYLISIGFLAWADKKK